MASTLLHAICVFVSIFSTAHAVGMMRREPKATPEGRLRHSLETVLKGATAQRLFAVEDLVRPTFEAFAKNSAGKVPVQAIHSIVRAYFMEEHGWLMTGFEFSSQRSTRLQEAQILKDKMPEFLKALSEVQDLDHGLSLSDVVATVAAIEHLLLDESVPLLKGAYNLNKLSVLEKLDRASLDDVLTSFLIIFRSSSSRNFTDIKRHQLYKAHAQKLKTDWENLVAFARATNTQATGVTGDLITFEEALKIVKDLALKYGEWQNSECSEIKSRLVELQTGSTGLVPFQAFQAEAEHPHYAFTESLEYLRTIGAIDESEEGHPKVLIANYVVSPSNCIGSSKYYSVCCLSECEYVMNELEAQLQTSEVPVQRLLDVVATVATSTVTVPRQLSDELVSKANAIVDRHYGLMQLHSGEFKKWLHFAFPNECPYPSRYEEAAEESEHEVADRWLGHNRRPAWQVSADAELVTV